MPSCALLTLRAGGEGAKKGKEHGLRLIVVDKHGVVRGSYLGLKPNTGDAEADAVFFENDMRHLRRQVDSLLEPERPAFLPRDVPAFNAALNGLSAALMLVGFACIRQRWVRMHAACMLTAIAVSAVFLTSYLYFHLIIKEGRPTRFADQAPDAPVWVGNLYLTVLISHTILAIPAAPLALVSAYFGLRGKILRHVRLVRFTFPIWLYVSLTGVVVYWMLYRLYPSS